MRFPRQTKVFRGPVDAAPFAAVFFCLILLLLLNSSLVFPPGIPIELPQAEDLPGLEAPTAVVTVDAAGRLYFENQVIEPDSFQAKLRQRVAESDRPLTLLVQADRSLVVDQLAQVMLLAKNAGVAAAFLATRSAPEPSPITAQP